MTSILLIIHEVRLCKIFFFNMLVYNNLFDVNCYKVWYQPDSVLAKVRKHE